MRSVVCCQSLAPAAARCASAQHRSSITSSSSPAAAPRESRRWLARTLSSLRSPPAGESLPPLLHPSAFSTARRISFLGQPASLQPAAATSTTTHALTTRRPIAPLPPPRRRLRCHPYLLPPPSQIGCRSLCRRLAETLSHSRVCCPSPPLTTASSPSSQLPSSRSSTSRARFSTPNRRIRSLARHRRSTSLYHARAARPSKTPPVVHTF